MRSSIPAQAQEAGAPAEEAAEAGAAKKSEFDLETWGQIKEVKGTDFWEVKYLQIEGRRAKAVTAFVKVPEDAVRYDDTVGRVDDLKEGDAVMVFGKRFESEAPSLGGYIGTDRQMKAVAALVLGDDVAVNEEFTDPRDDTLRWYKCAIAKTGGGLSVTYDSAEYKVAMERTGQIILRTKREKDAEKTKKVVPLKTVPLKTGLRVGFALMKSEDRPETGRSSDDKKEAYVAKKVFVPDRRMTAAVYRMLYE